MSAQSTSGKGLSCPAKARNRSVPPSMIASAPRSRHSCRPTSKNVRRCWSVTRPTVAISTVGGVDLLQRIALGRHDLGRGDPAIEPALHHGARAHDADLPELAARDGGVDLGDGVENRQGRDRQKLLDAEVAAHGGDGGRLGTRRLHALHQPREDLRLPAGILVAKVAAHFAHVGVGDRELQRNAGGCVPLDQAAIVEVGGGRADAADESDMHGATLAHRRAAGNAGAIRRGAFYLCEYDH